LGTPKTIQRFTLNRSGTPYGFASSTSQSGNLRLSHRTPIKNLFLSSAWAYPGHGFTGAITSGWLCAQEVLGRELSSSANQRKFFIDKVSKLVAKVSHSLQ